MKNDVIGIYKITNKLNNKVYIGQSIHIYRRWSEHCQPSTTSLIGKAIQKYGKENFIFEILEEVSNVNTLTQKESEYIKLYNSITPNGYNIIEESETNPSSYSLYDKQVFCEIVDLIINTDITFEEIAKKYNLNKRTITRINNGHTHKQENLIYPLRNTTILPKQIFYCIDCGKIISQGATRCDACSRVSKRYITNRPTREELKNLIRNKPFTKIGKMFNISDNAVRKWCDSYHLPRKSSEIKKYTDEDWELI